MLRAYEIVEIVVDKGVRGVLRWGMKTMNTAEIDRHLQVLQAEARKCRDWEAAEFWSDKRTALAIAERNGWGFQIPAQVTERMSSIPGAKGTEGEHMKLYHATSSSRASDIMEYGFRMGGIVWDHPDVVFFADRAVEGFGDMSGSSWIVIEADEKLLAADVYHEDEREWDNEQYVARCYCLPVKLVNQYPRTEEQGGVWR